MLKILILFSLTMNLSFAEYRLDEPAKKALLKDLRVGVAELKTENKGRVDLQLIKPGLYSELEEALKSGKFNRDELNIIKNNYEKFSRDPKITPANAEEAFYAFMENELNNLNKKPLVRLGEKAICHTPNDCGGNLKCIEDPTQYTSTNYDLKGRRVGQECNKDSDCASQECVLSDDGKKRMVCEAVSRCFRPLTIGEKCGDNPYCGEGQCLNFNSMTSATNECSETAALCEKDLDCCSGSCTNKRCDQYNFLCKKQCIKGYNKVEKGLDCCEGFTRDRWNTCVPDVFPSAIIQTYVAPVKSFLVSFMNFFISSADAGEIANIQKQFDAFLESNSNAPVGTSFSWGLGKFTLLPTGNILFTSNKGGSVELTEKSNIVKVAQASPDLRMSFAQTYGVDPLGLDKGQQAENATAIYNLAEKERARPATSSETSTKVNIPGFGNVEYTYAHTTGSGEDIVQVPASIKSATGEVYSPASEYYNSNEFAAMTGKKMTAEDYKFLEDEKKAATKTAQSAAKDGSAAAALEDEETFLNLGAENDGLGLADGVQANKNNLNKLHVSKTGEALNMEKDKAKLNFARKSNFVSCDIYFKDDFYNALKADGAFDLEVAMLGFEFVITGDSDSDYWRGGSVPSFPSVGVAGIGEVQDSLSAKLAAEAARNASSNSIYNRLKAIGLAHRQVRIATNKRIADITKKLTCACLDVQGYNKIANNEKKKFFENSCEEYAKYKNPETSADELNGDASGLKGKRMLVIWTQNLQQFHASLAVDNNAAYSELLKVSAFVNGEARFNETEQRNYDLFKFTIKNPSGAVAGLGAIVGALLAAGVIAIMGGFATTSILSVWGAAGIIAASAVTGAGGMWMIATLKGAWITMKPEISDGIVMPRTYSCGKKESCTDYTRTLVQPYNTVCNKHTSANACIKSFIIVNEGREAKYIVDPWIPVGMTRAQIVKNQPNYVEKLEEGFNAARNAMVMKNPGATGATGKKGEGNFVSESYLSEVFIDANIVGQYTPAIGNNMQENYFFGQDRVKLVKAAARQFAIDEGFLESDDEENLNEFADYAYEYHFLWPKKSRPGEISYPTVGLSTYLSYMSKEVSGNLSAGLSKTAIKLSKLQEQYQRDYNNTFDLYDKSLNQVDGLKKSLMVAEANKNKEALANLMNFNALLDSKALDAQMAGLGANTKGSTLTGASLTNGQTNFLKAVNNLRNTRKEQLKDIEHYKKTMAASGNKERAARVERESKKFSKNFATGNASFANARYGSNSSPLDSSAADANKDATANSYGAFDQGSGNNGVTGTGSLFGAGSGAGSGSKSSSAAGAGAAGGVNDADANKLADAIDARNKDNKGKYQSKDGQSLFEKVTNAYIRNYDKVLTKKKDKDVVEDKQ